MMDTNERQALVEAIERVEWQAVDAIKVDMYRNPFWEMRYGERGQRYTRQDSENNLKRLAGAITTDNPESLGNYYHWLRGLLVFRGMCTRHIQDMLDATGRVLGRLLPEEWPAIAPYHNGGYLGLGYDRPAAAALHAQAAGLAAAVTNRLYPPQDSPDETARRTCQRDMHYHLAYLCDALEMDDPTIFENHLGFLNQFLPQLGLSLNGTQRAFALLREELARSLPGEFQPPALALLDAVPAHLNQD